ncbi:MAG: 4-(cytidine 5'-diphospho)-2-C-methyl-D-erythritol kinase [Actinomycetota bacterium]|nr:4-(cytidine 5'-diphospho)-2-C-methyl-D-erythritol kinase [Actinomycetota bacterium]
MIGGTAYAKVNLGLRVGARGEDGFHPIDGIFQSVKIVDTLTLSPSEVDEIRSSDGRPVPDGIDNLAFRAAAAVRDVTNSSQPIAMGLDKTIPVAAGLGGGSADAAAALVLASRFFGVGDDTLHELAPQLGSDVPFCLRGGTARVGGRGDELESLDPLSGFVLAVVVPPFELPTPAVFTQWDTMGEPPGLRIEPNQLPPTLRGKEALVNDLYPAAVILEPQLDDWRRDLEHRWGRPVMLSGSGPSLYAFFLDQDEATDATTAVPAGARFAEPSPLSPVGWQVGTHFR